MGIIKKNILNKFLIRWFELAKNSSRVYLNSKGLLVVDLYRTKNYSVNNTNNNDKYIYARILKKTVKNAENNNTVNENKNDVKSNESIINHKAELSNYVVKGYKFKGRNVLNRIPNSSYKNNSNNLDLYEYNDTHGFLFKVDNDIAFYNFFTVKGKANEMNKYPVQDYKKAYPKLTLKQIQRFKNDGVTPKQVSIISKYDSFRPLHLKNRNNISQNYIFVGRLDELNKYEDNSGLKFSDVYMNKDGRYLLDYESKNIALNIFKDEYNKPILSINKNNLNKYKHRYFKFTEKAFYNFFSI